MQLERDAVVIESRAVLDSDEIIAMTASGVVIRTPVSEFRIIGRGTKGVRVMRLDENDRVVGIAFVQQVPDNGRENDVTDTDKTPAPQ
jgi:DNA gyrase subunit A